MEELVEFTGGGPLDGDRAAIAGIDGEHIAVEGIGVSRATKELSYKTIHVYEYSKEIDRLVYLTGTCPERILAEVRERRESQAKKLLEWENKNCSFEKMAKDCTHRIEGGAIQGSVFYVCRVNRLPCWGIVCVKIQDPGKYGGTK